jgi:chorismate synthase
MRVAAGAIAKQVPARARRVWRVRGYLALSWGRLSPAQAGLVQKWIDNPVFLPGRGIRCLNWKRFMDALRKEGDSIGARK